MNGQLFGTVQIKNCCQNQNVYWILFQYCLDMKKMSYQQLLTDTTSEQSTKQEIKSFMKKTKASTQHRIGNMAVEVL